MTVREQSEVGDAFKHGLNFPPIFQNTFFNVNYQGETLFYRYFFL